MDTKRFLDNEHVIMKGYSGSVAYGTNLPTSDIDIRGIFCAEPINLRTPFYPIKEVIDDTEEDTKLYELSHFMKLCLDCNPNILEMIWLSEEDITFSTPAYDLLRSYRYDFLSSKVAFTTSGYAMSQLKRISQSKKKVNHLPELQSLCKIMEELMETETIDADWVENHCGSKVMGYMQEAGYFISSVPIFDSYKFKSFSDLYDNISMPTEKKIIPSVVCQPRQSDYVSAVQWFGATKLLPSDFDITNYRDNYRLISFSKDLFGLYPDKNHQTYSNQGHLNLETVFDGERHTLPHPIAILKFNREEYSKAKDDYDKFWEWKNNRNPTRMAMEEEFGVDLKHAMHLVRLLRMGEEALRDGEIIVKRPDAEELLSIRNGAWSYEEILAYATDMDDKIQKVLYKQTNLRKKPDINHAANVLMEIQDLIWSNK